MRGYLLLVAIALAAGCGDNSKQCGPGTLERSGVCEPDGTPPTCPDPAGAFGRLDLDRRAPCDHRPRAETAHDARGEGTHDLVTPGGSTFLVTVTTAHGAGTFELDFARRPRTDLEAGENDARSGEVENPITGTILIQRLVGRDRQARVRVRASAGLDAQIQTVGDDEGRGAAVVDDGVDTAVLRGDGWRAWIVTDQVAIDAGVP